MKENSETPDQEYRNTMREACDKYRATLKNVDERIFMEDAWQLLVETETEAHNLRCQRYDEMEGK